MKNLKIGNLILKNGLVLAPMAGVTDIAFRQICKRYGAELLTTEMISAKAIHFHDDKTLELARFYPYERPIAVQIFGSEPQIMAEAATFLASLPQAPDIIDINMGCPVRKIVGNGEGAALMQNPALAQQIVRAVKDAVSLPVTVKCRVGFDAAHKNVVSFAQAMEQAGADSICVHGRTREQMYQLPIDIESIAQVKKHVKIPVIANGGIQTVEDAKRMIEQTDCDALAIAQGSYGNPFLFAQISDYLDGKEIRSVTLCEKLQTAKEHFALLLTEKGERTGVLEARRHISWYFVGMNGAAALRKSFFAAETPKDFYDIFEKIEYLLKK